MKFNRFLLVAFSTMLIIACSRPSKKGVDEEVESSEVVVDEEEVVEMDSMAFEILSQQEVTVNANASQYYKALCTTCHGLDGSLGKFGATNLTSSKMILKDRIEIIANGKGIMIGFNDQMNQQEIESVAFYLTNLRH